MESLVLASCSASPRLLLSAARRRLLPQEDKRNNAANLSRKREKRRERKKFLPLLLLFSADVASDLHLPHTATTDPVPRQRSSAMAPDLPTGTFASGPPEPQALPFFLSPPPPTPPLPAGHPLLQSLPPPPGPIIFRLHPAFIAEMDYRRSQSLARFLKDEGAVPPPEEDKKREQVIRKLKKIVTDWAKVVAYEQGVPPRRATATVLTYGSYTLGIVHKRKIAIAKARGDMSLAVDYLKKYLELFMADHDAWRELAEIYVCHSS